MRCVGYIPVYSKLNGDIFLEEKSENVVCRISAIVS